MVAVCIFRPPILNVRVKLTSLPPSLYLSHVFILFQNRQRRFRCSSTGGQDKEDTPRLLKIAVSGVTELLRLLRSGSQTLNREDYTNNARDEPSVRRIDDVISILQSDYERAYFLTGNFTSAIYAEDCSFEDPTIKFRGKDLYSRNLELLVPFFDTPSLVLRKIEKGVNDDMEFVVATWALRTYLKLPWRPLISIEGTTVYDLDDEFKIVRHVESWNVSAFEALIQIFTPGLRKDG
ncbi:uncharacterized protein LOC131222619 isoform X2 [Magnolia sinica]|uniref:uncharacterized protein LOC131222619 isoform X2 n=1 Tax=Magnolia sinica TaxID=86752 RepID=UPI00265886A4|nr:uncharacterized protein LOC131222619 isoform X2 [Magnolia sinica]